VSEAEGDITVAALLAARVHMTEGRLYTAVLAVVAAVLLTITGLPNAHRTTMKPTQAPPTVIPGQP
jgi:hypothetical protein